MRAYSEAYLEEVVETQGKLFDFFSYKYSEYDTCDFIEAYMKSTTRHRIDICQAYVATLDYNDLLELFLKEDTYVPKKGNAVRGFRPMWIGEFYAYYQWYYNIPSSEVFKKVPLEFLLQSYNVLHDLDLELAVKRVREANKWYYLLS